MPGEGAATRKIREPEDLPEYVGAGEVGKKTGNPQFSGWTGDFFIGSQVDEGDSN